MCASGPVAAQPRHAPDAIPDVPDSLLRHVSDRRPRHRLDGDAAARDASRSATSRVVPLQVVVGATSYDEGVDPDATPDDDRRGAARVDAGEHLAADAGGVPGGLPAAPPRRRRRGAVRPPVRGDERHLGVGAARRPGLADAGACRRHPAARDGAPASRCSPQPTCSTTAAPSEEAAGAALARADATTSLFYVDTLEYLRRGGRIGAAAALLGSALVGQAAARDRRRADRAPGEGADDRPRAEPARGARGRGRRRLARSTSRSRTWPTRTGPRRSRSGCVRRLADNLSDRELCVGEVGAVIGAHVGPGHGRRGRLAALTAPGPGTSTAGAARPVVHSRRIVPPAGTGPS